MGRACVPGYLTRCFSNRQFVAYVCSPEFAGVHPCRQLSLQASRFVQEGVKIDGMVYADAELLKQIEGDQTREQIANVATLRACVGKSLAMPDAHQGLLLHRGVAAADLNDGVVSAGGVGFDINCGVRLLAVDADPEDVRKNLEALLNQIFRDVPCARVAKVLWISEEGD